MGSSQGWQIPQNYTTATRIMAPVVILYPLCFVQIIGKLMLGFLRCQIMASFNDKLSEPRAPLTHGHEPRVLLCESYWNLPSGKIATCNDWSSIIQDCKKCCNNKTPGTLRGTDDLRGAGVVTGEWHWWVTAAACLTAYSAMHYPKPHPTAVHFQLHQAQLHVKHTWNAVQYCCTA